MNCFLVFFSIFPFFGIPVVLADDPNGSEAEIRAGRAVDALLRMKHGPQDVGERSKRIRMNLGISEDQLLEGFISRIKQVDPVVNQEMHSSSEYNEFYAIHAARAAIELYPGNSRLEKEVLDAYRRSESTDSKMRSAWIVSIADHGSNQAVAELRKLLVDSREIEEFDRWVSSRLRFDRGAKKVSRNVGPDSSRLSGALERSHAVLFLWHFWMGLVGLALVAYGLGRKKRSVWIGGILLMITASVIYLLKKEGEPPQTISPPAMGFADKRSIQNATE